MSANGLLNPDELPLTERQGLMGLIYLRAIAAVAGYSFAVPESDFDSIDAKISSRQGKRQGVDFQVKCTSIDLGKRTGFSFELPLKNYNDLRADSIIPRYLLVVVVPEVPGDWLRQNERRLNLRRCGYWTSLRGAPPTTNVATVTTRLLRSNVLTPSSLRSLMHTGGPK